MTSDENRSTDNLILLCVKHADEIDLPGRVETYPAKLLRQWKADQLASFDKATEGWALTDEEAAEVVAVSTDPTVVVQGQNINVGGTGGSAAGAGGGGGGAIGPGALGGAGGAVHINLDGSDAVEPGSGGGGGGVIAAGASRSAASPATEGVGFSSGVDGEDGGDTAFGTEGNLLVTASGGRGGLAGTGVRLVSTVLRVSAVMLVNYAEQRDGLACIVGGGWQSLSLLNVPASVVFPLFILFEAGGVEVGEFTIRVDVLDPSGVRRSRISFPLTVVEAGDIVRIPRYCNLPSEVETFGVWTLAMATPHRPLAQVQLLIKRAGEA
jgi:hypothetical protein